jgi:large subunit ribosomal protein LP0
MSGATVAAERKSLMYSKTQDLFSSHKNYMLISIKRVKSTQLKDAKASFDPKVKLLFAKNKIIKKALNDLDAIKYKDLIEKLHGDVAIVFYDEVDPRTLLDVSRSHMRKANAVAGDISPTDVVIPAGPTGLGPEKINIFQAARMNTKINKGKIDLVSDHKLLSAGDAVRISDAGLLKLLNILPFEFGLEIMQCFEGSEVFTKEILLIGDNEISEIIADSVSTIAAFSLGAGITTACSVPFEVKNAFYEVAKVSLATEFTIKELPN